MRHRDALVQLRPGLGRSERELGRPDERDERVRDLVEGSPRQQPEGLECTHLAGVELHCLYDLHADCLEPIQQAHNAAEHQQRRRRFARPILCPQHPLRDPSDR